MAMRPGLRDGNPLVAVAPAAPEPAEAASLASTRVSSTQINAKAIASAVGAATARLVAGLTTASANVVRCASAIQAVAFDTATPARRAATT